MQGLTLSIRSFAIVVCVGAAGTFAQVEPISQQDNLSASTHLQQTAQNAAVQLATSQPPQRPTHPGFDATQDFQYISLLALQDLFLRESNFSGKVSSELENLVIFPPGQDHDNLRNHQRLLVALAHTYASLAYNNELGQILPNTEAVWSEIQRDIIGQPNANSNPAVPCSNFDLTGAVYPTDSFGNETMSADVGMFIALSGYLYEISGAQMYLDAALQTAEFAQNHLITDNSTIVDGFNFTSCSATSTSQAGSTGAVIEGLSVLASYNSSWIPLLDNVTSAAVMNQDFSNLFADEGNSISNQLPDVILLRGLSEALQRQNLSSSVEGLVTNFTTTQFNASLQVYNPDTGNSSDTDAIMSALYAFNAAALIPSSSATSDEGPPLDVSPPTSSPIATPSAAPSATHSSSHVGAIAGGVVGGTVFLALLAFFVIWFLRRRHHRTAPSAAFLTFDAGRMVNSPAVRMTNDEENETMFVRDEVLISPPPKNSEATTGSYSSGNLLIDRSRSPSISEDARTGLPSSAEATLGEEHRHFVSAV